MKVRNLLLIVAGLSSASAMQAGRKIVCCGMNADSEHRCALRDEDWKIGWEKADCTDPEIVPWVQSVCECFVVVPAELCSIIRTINSTPSYVAMPPALYPKGCMVWIPREALELFKIRCGEAGQPSASFDSALFWAVKTNNIDLSKIILSIPGIRLDACLGANGENILHYAVDAGVEMLKLLCQSGKVTDSIIDKKTDDGTSLLARALSSPEGREIQEYLFNDDYEKQHHFNKDEHLKYFSREGHSVLCAGITAQRQPDVDAFSCLLEELSSMPQDDDISAIWETLNRAITLADRNKYAELSELLSSYNNL